MNLVWELGKKNVNWHVARIAPFVKIAVSYLVAGRF